MRKDKQQALRLRLSGKSYNEIAGLIGVPKSTLSNWLSNLELPDKARKRLAHRVSSGASRGLEKRNRNQTHLAIQRMRLARNAGQKEVSRLTLHELTLLGAGLYWAEGYKREIIRNGKKRTSHRIALANSDPMLIRMFLQFLRKSCRVTDDRITASVRLYQHMNEKVTLAFWQKITGLPKKNFRKTYYGVSKSSMGIRPFNRLPYGTIVVQVNDTHLFHRIMGMIEGLAKVS